MPSDNVLRQRLKHRLSRTVVYTAPLMIAVTGAASLHGIISDLRDGIDRAPGARTATSQPTPSAIPEGMPEGAPEAMPEAAPEAAPEALPEAQPEAMPEAVPEGTPEGGY